MGKKLLSTLLFMPALAIAQIEYVHFETVCVDIETLEQTLQKHGEKPFVVGVGHRLVDNKKVFHPTVMFVNPKTKSWTLTEKVDNTYCVIGVGTKLEPYIEKK